MEDKLIIKYIKRCNQKGMQMLIDKYSKLLIAIIRTHLNPVLNYEEECLSDVLFSIWENIEGFDGNENSFKNWICAIAKYKSIDYKRKYLSKINSEIDSNASYIDENLARLELKEEIDEILSFLNDKDKELFIRYYLNGDKLDEIASDISTTVSSLHSRLSRGRKTIRNHILK